MKKSDEMARYKKEILEKFEELPVKMQISFTWFIENIETVERMCRISQISPEELRTQVQKALDEEDYLMYVLLVFKDIYDKNHSNN